MNSETPVALAPVSWPVIVVVLGFILLVILLFRWRNHQDAREAEGERRPGDGAPARPDREKLLSALDLDSLEVSDIMIHRTTMRGLDAGDPPEEVVRAVLESPYTRMPLWSGSVDNIVGVVHA
jgi:Mg2+/Co2+ transporter CorB